MIIPIASLEQHANHLPVNTDSNIVSTVAQRAAQTVEFPVPVLPAVWTGYSPHHMRHPGSVTLKYHTFVEVLTQVAKSVHHHGFRKILLLNGHGGNSAIVAGMRTKLAEEDGVVSVVGCDYWDAPGVPEAMRRLCPRRSRIGRPRGRVRDVRADASAARARGHAPGRVGADRGSRVEMRKSDLQGHAAGTL